MNKALFIDRDGVINREINYVHRIGDFEFLPGIFTHLQKFNSLGYLIIIITNQAGIGRGIYTVEDYNKLTSWMLDEFKKNKVEITDVYFDPYHPEHGVGEYRKESYDRKPNPGMIVKASKKHAINLEKSILIGDKLSDIQAGLNAGVGDLFLINTGHEIEDVKVPIECKLVNSLDEVLKMQ